MLDSILPLDGNTPIGEDLSGNNNDWTPEGFGGSVELDNPSVSGARPILNTVNGGTSAAPGVFGSKENKTYVTTTANGSVYQFDITSGDNPSLEFIRGATYKFNYSSHIGHPSHSHQQIQIQVQLHIPLEQVLLVM